MTKVEKLIEQAKSKYPAYIHCRDKLSWKESMELGKECTVHCAATTALAMLGYMLIAFCAGFFGHVLLNSYMWRKLEERLEKLGGAG
ncbi:MAG: hypothetical protein MJZ99_07035 [Bacteroidales bacterium]|nr:hypothetical protein [Bacteroidales bacterium]